MMASCGEIKFTLNTFDVQRLLPEGALILLIKLIFMMCDCFKRLTTVIFHNLIIWGVSAQKLSF